MAQRDVLPWMMAACEAGNADRVELVLQQRGVEVASRADSDGWTPLLIAVFYGRPEVVRVLLRYRAPVNQGWRQPDGTIGSPLNYAIQEGHTEVVVLLLDSGAKYNRRCLP